MHRFKNILFVTNNGPDELSIARAVELAERNDAKLTLIDVAEKMPTWAGDQLEKLEWDKIHQADIKNRHDRLKRAAEAYRDRIRIESKVLEGKKFLETIRQVLKHGHDLVMKDTAIHKGIIRRVFATEDMRLLRKCPCPVLLTKHDSAGRFTNIMAAVDFDDLNNLDTPSPNNTLNTQILDMSVSLAHAENSNLNIVHVYQIIGEGLLKGGRTGMSDREIATYSEDTRKNYEMVVEKLLVRAKKRLGDLIYGAVNPDIQIIKGHPAVVIPQQAKLLNTDLLVMGTVARTGIPGFLIGNTAETILNDIDCSVLALKPEGFISPVTLAS